MVDVNLTAPLLLTHRLVPGMLERGRGHVVFISSIAGKVGPAFNEPYAATKAGLVGLTQSLRAEYQNAPVGFSVVCPGFIAGDGMYERMLEEGHRSNRLMGETSTEKISEAVVRAIREDRAGDPRERCAGAPDACSSPACAGTRGAGRAEVRPHRDVSQGGGRARARVAFPN